MPKRRFKPKPAPIVRRNTPATQKDIAQALGISQFTVSMALKGSERIAQETREKILNTAEKLGYRMNAAASAISSGRFGGVALLRGAPPDMWWLHVDLLHGIQTGLEKQRQRLVMARMDPRRLEDENEVPRMLRELSADGLLVHWIPGVPERLPALLRRFRIPAIYLNVKQEFDAVHPDDFAMGSLAAKFFLERGHQTFAYVDNFDQGHYSVQDRREGFRSTLQAAGKTTLHVGQEDCPSAVDPALVGKIRAILKAPNRPTAWLGYAVNECMAVWLAAQEAGLNVPRDCSIFCLSLDNAHRGNDRIIWTGVEIPWMPLGETACEMLMKKIQNPARKLPSQKISPWLRLGTTSTTKS